MKEAWYSSIRKNIHKILFASYLPIIFFFGYMIMKFSAEHAISTNMIAIMVICLIWIFCFKYSIGPTNEEISSTTVSLSLSFSLLFGLFTVKNSCSSCDYMRYDEILLIVSTSLSLLFSFLSVVLTTVRRVREVNGILVFSMAYFLAFRYWAKYEYLQSPLEYEVLTLSLISLIVYLITNMVTRKELIEPELAPSIITGALLFGPFLVIINQDFSLPSIWIFHTLEKIDCTANTIYMCRSQLILACEKIRF